MTPAVDKVTLEEDRFPVCWCGARRYCGEECQKADWDAGHAQTCASGHTWSARIWICFGVSSKSGPRWRESYGVFSAKDCL